MDSGVLDGTVFNRQRTPYLSVTVSITALNSAKRLHAQTHEDINLATESNVIVHTVLENANDVDTKVTAVAVQASKDRRWCAKRLRLPRCIIEHKQDRPDAPLCSCDF
eukprot:6125367-Prymnesium_polylepis.1